MSTDFKRISRTAISALSVTSLLAASLTVVSPGQALAADTSNPETLAEANAQIDGTMSSLDQQIASLDKQIAEVGAEIGELEKEAQEARELAKQYQKTLLQSIRDSWVTGEGEKGEWEILASSQSFSEFISTKEARDRINDDQYEQYKKYEEALNTAETKLKEAQEKRDGLVKLRSELEGKRAARAAQEQAKAALAEQTLGQEKLYQEIKKQKAAQTVAVSTPTYGGYSGGAVGGGGPDGLEGSIGYARAGGNCVNEPGVNNPRNGNPINWPVTSSTPWVGATALWTFNHTGVVTGIWRSGGQIVAVEVRHQNWYGGNQHKFSIGAFRGFR